MKKQKFSVVTTWHYIRLTYRSLLFVLLLAEYLSYRTQGGGTLTAGMEQRPVILTATWAVFVVEMIFRFFPSRYESPGSQKQFSRNYIKSGRTEIIVPDNNATVLVLLIWIVFNL